jgi:putative peptide zinc metalloprotease protein
MQQSGFTDHQWLVQRDGQFLQVTELLYHLLEQINGSRDLGEIASAMTDSTEWMITTDDVRVLLHSKLIPMGLIAAGADAAHTPAATSAQSRARSPLAVNMKVKTIGPRAIEPITRVLQYLYAPLFLIPILILIAAAHVWLYFVHGIGGGLEAALYTPGLLLLALVIMLISGVVHEFGHASALRYGGGKVRGMGVGFYLIYPAFFTDTTDSYRLGRWAKVRTDLGGFYFHLIFAVAMMLLAVLTGWKFLFLIAVFINIEFIRQMLPFFRLDGYWVLADLTGIPDFFSQIGPFLRSVLPVPGWKGTRLPRLKTWVKVVFIAYIVLTLPVLAFLVYLVMTRMPRFAVTTLGALLLQVRHFTEAISSGNGVAIALVVAQILMLGLSLFAIAFLFYSLLWGPIRAVWKWSKPSPMRQVVGALTGVAMTALLAYLWVPEIPVPGASAPSGTQNFAPAGRVHVQTQVSYPQSPPVGGNHAPVWQNCGFYDAPVANENAVHSLEHGAVWIAFRPGIAGEQVEALREITYRSSHVLVSPYPGLQAPVVASAWGKQLRVDSAEDPRLGQFLRAFRFGSQAPEQGGPCTGGTGKPD